AAAHRIGVIFDGLQHAPHIGHDILAIHSDRPVALIAQCHMHYGAVFGDVDMLAFAHLGAALLDPGGPRQVEQGGERIGVDPVLAIVEQNPRAAGRETLAAPGILGEHLTHTGLAQALAMLAERVETGILRPLGHILFLYRTGRSPAAHAARVSAAKSLIRPASMAARAPAVSS